MVLKNFSLNHISFWKYLTLTPKTLLLLHRLRKLYLFNISQRAENVELWKKRSQILFFKRSFWIFSFTIICNLNSTEMKFLESILHFLHWAETSWRKYWNKCIILLQSWMCMNNSDYSRSMKHQWVFMKEFIRIYTWIIIYFSVNENNFILKRLLHTFLNIHWCKREKVYERKLTQQ